MFYLIAILALSGLTKITVNFYHAVIDSNGIDNIRINHISFYSWVLCLSYLIAFVQEIPMWWTS